MDGVPKLNIDKFVKPLSINGLRGRVMHMPAPKNKKREILLIYGHHASLERMYGFATAFNRYGAVTVPDMPGFGGMDSLYKIGKKPDLDTMADYLAAFIKLRYKRRPITIIAISLGFAVTTRMLQKYPNLTNQVTTNISAIGFVHRDDVSIAKFKKAIFRGLARFLSFKLPSIIAGSLMQPPLIRWMYRKNNIKAHDATETEERRRYRIEFEVWLWRNNDIRTHFYTLYQMLSMNLCTKKINLPVYHVAVEDDHYINNYLVEQHMQVIYSDFIKMPLTGPKVHAPTILATAKEAGVFIPSQLRRLLNKQ